MRYFTKEWFLTCQNPINENMREKPKEVSAAYHAACEREKLPEKLLEDFSFHDGVVSSITMNADCTLSICSPFSNYHTLIFRDAILKQDLPTVGAEWLYEELYRHKSGIGYEAHILFYAPTGAAHKRIQKTDLLDSKIICSEILIR